MSRKSLLNYFRKNLNALVMQAAAHLMALTASVRGLQVYPEVRAEILAFLIPYILLLLLQSIVYSQKAWVSVCYVLLQASLVSSLYLVAPFADYWALLLFPASVYVMKKFSSLLGYLFILLFVVDISVMISIAEKDAAIEFVPIYIVGFLLISSFSLVLRQTTVAKENAEDLSRRLADANAQLRFFSERTARLAILEERTAIARDLHDSATQTLFSANLLLGSLEQNYDITDDGLKADIEKISSLTQTAKTQLRSLIKELNPGDGVYRDFQVELNSYLRELKKNHDFSVHYRRGESDLPIIFRNSLLYIIREALHNSMKHSGASEAFLTIEKSDDAWIIAIRDEGTGFDNSLLIEKSRQGLENMRNRCLQLGGDLSISSAPGEGTSVRIKIESNEELDFAKE